MKTASKLRQASAVIAVATATFMTASPAMAQLAGVTPASVLFFHDLSAANLASGECRTIATADPGLIMVGSLRIFYPAAGPGTSLTVDSSPTGLPPFLLLSRQASFNTAQVVEGLPFTGQQLRVCNGSFSTANTGFIEIEGTAIEYMVQP